MIDTDRLWSKESEAAVLGSMIVGPECIAKVLPILPTEGAFFEESHQLIYAALLRLFTGSKPIDAVSLRTELKTRNQIEAVGGVEYLSRIMQSVPHAANAEYYAGVIRDRHQYRTLIRNIESMQKILDEPGSVNEQAQRIQEIALNIETGKPETEYFEVSEHATKVTGGICNSDDVIRTGFRNIDRLIGGVSPGELIILAARPSVGKSALALDIALNMAKVGKSVVFFTLEMTYKALIERAVCSMAKVNSQSLKTDNPPTEEYEKVCGEAFELAKLHICFHERGVTPERQVSFIRTWKKTKGVDVVFIDYLQLMGAGSKTENRVQEVSQISRKLKLAAGQEHIPIIALSQLNRQVEARTDHRPRLSDLRDSGSLEQDADVVALLHREDYYRRKEKPDADSGDVDGSTEVIIAKNRRGPTGIAELTFLEEYAKFGDLQRGF